MARVRITNQDGIERDTIPLSHLAERRVGFNAKPLAEVTVSRADLNDVSGLTPGEDRVYVEEGGTDTFAGLLQSPGREGSTATIQAPALAAQYMARAKPVPLGQEKIAVDDSTLVQECIDATPQVTAGTLETVTSGQTYIFSGVTQFAKAKKVAETAGGELVFNADLSVDYLDTRGTDETATTLSPANGSFVEDTFTVERNGVSGNTTHLKVYGVGQGTSQVEATVVPADDGGSYTNAVTYTNPTWSSGDDEIWGQRTNKDVKNVDALQSWGLALIADLQDTELRVTTVVKGDDVELGDRYHVVHPEEGVDQDLRAVEVTRLLAAEGGERYETVFSNYATAHVDEMAADHKDVARYNQAYEGDLTQVQQGPGRGPVGPGHDYVVYVYYPDDVVAEVNAQMRVAGLNYRAFSQGVASGGDHTHDVDINVTTANAATNSGNVNPIDNTASFSSGGGTLSQSFTLPNPFNQAEVAYVYVTVQNVGSSTAGADLKIENTTKGVTLQAYEGFETSYGPGEFRLYQVAQTNSNGLDGDEIEWTLQSSASGDFRLSYGAMVLTDHAHAVDDTQTSDASGPHTHVPDPGIIDWDGFEQDPAHYPENVDVVVNGTSQGYTLGDGTGEFQEVVDLDGALSQGWNELRLTSDALGHLDASFSADLYRQSL